MGIKFGDLDKWYDAIDWVCQVEGLCLYSACGGICLTSTKLCNCVPQYNDGKVTGEIACHEVDMLSLWCYSSGGWQIKLFGDYRGIWIPCLDLRKSYPDMKVRLYLSEHVIGRYAPWLSWSCRRCTDPDGHKAICLTSVVSTVLVMSGLLLKDLYHLSSRVGHCTMSN